MEFRYPPESEAFRAKVRSFLSAHLPSDWEGVGALSEAEAPAFMTKWRSTLAANGMIGVAWPAAYGGGGLTKLEQVILAEEFARAGVPTGIPNDTFSVKMVGNTLLKWGTEDQKRHFIPRIISGEHIWCQGYSEPDTGSDLGGLTTRARLDGDEWIIDGQKIWTSNAHMANWVFCLVRTDPEAPKHKGISFLLVPLEQPGVELRRITMMSSLDEFNETFLTGARTAKDNVVGPINGGWAVAMTLLGHERGEEAAINPINFRFEWDRLVSMTRELGKDRDPLIRLRLARCYEKLEVMRYLGYRVLTGVLRDGVMGPEASISKLYWSEYHQEVTALAVEVLGARALVSEGRRPPRAYRADDPGAPNCTASWLGAMYNARAGTIYAGTSEVQRNILGESVLGLPKEPATR